jgi:uncharacterized lipoprotein YehR (DUF1307 family)
MKKYVKVLAFALVAVMLCVSLVSCGKKLLGDYEASVGGDLLGYTATYAFSGSKVTVTKEATVLGSKKEFTFEGKYEIKDDTITFTFETEDDDIKSGSFAFEETDKGIKIGLVEYEKKN